jgi:hypothetical protein
MGRMPDQKSLLRTNSLTLGQRKFLLILRCVTSLIGVAYRIN